MFGEAFLSLLPMIPASMLVLFFFVAMNVLYRALTVPPGFDKENDGHCAACGYVIGTLSNQRCPECGVDLLKAGLLTRRMFVQLRGSSFGAIAAWTVLLGSFGGTSVAIWGSVVRSNQMMSSAFTGGITSIYTQAASYGPVTNWDEETREIKGETFVARIEIVVDSTSQKPFGDVKLILEMPDTTEYMLVIDEDSAWILKDEKNKKVASGKQINADAIDKLFALGGFDPSEDLYRSFSGQLSVLVDSAVTDGVNGLQNTGTIKLAKVQKGNDESMNLSSYGWATTYGTNTTTTTAGLLSLPSMPYAVWSPILYTFLVLLAVYIAGIIFIFKRRRKLLNLGRYTPSTSIE